MFEKKIQLNRSFKLKRDIPYIQRYARNLDLIKDAEENVVFRLEVLNSDTS